MKTLMALAAICLPSLLIGCLGQSADYGTPAVTLSAAQGDRDLSGHFGDLVEVSGVVSGSASPGELSVTLDGTIVCEFESQLSAMAESMRLGQRVRIWGTLREWSEDRARLTGCVMQAPDNSQAP